MAKGLKFSPCWLWG